MKESLNGELNNYQFSARGVIDRYNAHDMPLGWILPNDGYGAGYGQTETLDGNIANLKSLSDYAHGKGVEIGLWTQSDLHPKAGVSALLQRDIVKEVRDAGVRVLKTDVAWVDNPEHMHPVQKEKESQIGSKRFDLNSHSGRYAPIFREK